MRSLILVDDKKLRREAFAGARKLLLKLEQLESHVRVFEARDRRQFLDWQEVTFRRERDLLAQAQSVFQDLNRTYNRIVALAHVEGVPLTQAAQRIFAEQNRHREGDEGARDCIESEWQRREDALERDSLEQARLERERLDRKKAREERRQRDEEVERRRRLDNIALLSDEDLFDSVQSPKRAVEWLWLALWDARETGDGVLFFRIWDSTHTKLRTAFSRDFQKSFGMNFDDILDRMRFIQEGADVAGSTSATPSEDLKLLYRQVARRLHPDLQADAMTAWQKSLWLRAQDAYRTADRNELSKILRLILLRNGELNSLRLSEIIASRDWLMSELQNLESSVRGFKRSPAWGFSRRKDLGPVQRKVERELRHERDQIETRIEELELRLAVLNRSFAQSEF